jgi:hypothetical protein
VRIPLIQVPPANIGHFRASAYRCVNKKRGELREGSIARRVRVEMHRFVQKRVQRAPRIGPSFTRKVFQGAFSGTTLA